MISTENKKEINEALQRIGSHDLFVRSSIYSRLLTYLVEKALAGEDLKEYTIGTDLFGENYLSDKNDGTVRSKMYKLRNKLSEYYETEGKDEKLIFHIKKGQYNLSFEQAKPEHSGEVILNLSRKSIAISGLLISLFFIVYLVVQAQLNPTSKLWYPFFSNNANNLVVVSDHYVVSEKLSDSTFHAVLYANILNNKSLLEYAKVHPNQILGPTDYTFISEMCPYGIKTISEWFFAYDTNYDIKLESKLNSEDISNNNLIFIGQFKTMNLSRSLFLKDSKVFSTYLDGFRYSENGKDMIYNTTHNQNGKKEYAMVSYSSFVDGKNAFYFVSNNDIGVVATLKKFTNKAWLKEFENQRPKHSKHFNALFEVSGLQRTDISCELIKLEFI